MAKPQGRAFNLPFKEQAAFFRRKVNVPTQAWDDLTDEDHAQGFMVAGLHRMDMLDDMRQAVKRYQAGASLEAFRKDFDKITAGWSYHGSRDWRSKIIAETNLRTSYQAGRWEQLQAIKHRRPYWQYVHADGEKHPRPLHQAWGGKVLAADDPWWDVHYPPNGWGCQCTVTSLAARDLDDLGKDGPDPAPYEPPVDGHPAGVDKSFAYNVGKAARSMPAAVRFGQKVMTLPATWRDAVLADAQRRPTDLFADWPGTVNRAAREQAAGAAHVRGTAHPLGFLPPKVAQFLLDGAGPDGRAFAAPEVTTALLAADDRQVYHALRAVHATDRDVLAEALRELPRRMAQSDTLVVWDTAQVGGNAQPGLVYAWPLADGRWFKAVFRLDERRGDRATRQVLLDGNWLITSTTLVRDNLIEAHYVRLQGEVK